MARCFAVLWRKRSQTEEIHREWAETRQCLWSHPRLPVDGRLLRASYQRALDGPPRGVGQVRPMFMPHRSVVNKH